MSIYVEILVRAPMDALWAHTQTAELHEKWNLRFSRIDIGFGLAVSGEGETVGQRNLTDGSRSSALRFGSGAPLSIIREGSGYWKYIPPSSSTSEAGAESCSLRRDETFPSRVHNSVWGPLSGYRGSFNVEWRKVTAGEVPSHILLQRQERRD